MFRAAEADTGAALATVDAAEADTNGKRIVPRVVGLLDGGLRGDRMLPAASTHGLTWWRAYNAVTEYVDWTRGADGATRMESAWFGQGAQIKRRAFDLALKFAA